MPLFGPSKECPAVTPSVSRFLAKDPHPSIRYQSIRIAGEISLPEADFLAITKDAPTDHRRVRAALANSLRYHKSPTPAMITLAARLGNAPLNIGGWDTYDRTFERYLARWAWKPIVPQPEK